MKIKHIYFLMVVLVFLPVLIWPISLAITGNSKKISNEITQTAQRIIEDLGMITPRAIEQALDHKSRELESQTRPVARPVNQEHLKCLAANIYHESAGEPFMGQVAVARVVMNRVLHGFGSNPCRVIYAHHSVPHPETPEETVKVCQFSWVCEGKKTPPRNASYVQAEQIAHEVLAYDSWREEIPNNMLFFHNLSVNPRWKYRRVMTIGNHVFYATGREKQQM
jgi:spore germination cell wall hydrolase CwlJ-like protein